MPLYDYPPTGGGWKKFEGNPILGDDKIGTCFDIFMLPDEDGLRMYFSWRPKQSLAVTVSKDGGESWTPLRIILEPRKDTGWEDDLNRNTVVKVGNTYHMWYVGQARGYSSIGYATSPDGYTFERQNGGMPVLIPERYWENRTVMCPHVLWDDINKVFRMWYSGGETYEPNAIGYATSTDGINWAKHPANPIFVPNPQNPYEQERVAACQVMPVEDGYLMFYIGFEDIDTARICLAKSPDGITRWKRSSHNPIVAPSEGMWDAHATYKPFVLYDRGTDKWTLYYNGRRQHSEYIGKVFLEGSDLGF
jgi:predicted GH43/DUF377 family glycosyl hydrolase